MSNCLIVKIFHSLEEFEIYGLWQKQRDAAVEIYIIYGTVSRSLRRPPAAPALPIPIAALSPTHRQSFAVGVCNNPVLIVINYLSLQTLNVHLIMVILK